MSLDVHYMAITAERDRLPTQARRGWLATEARSAARFPSPAGRLRHGAGSVLVRIGERLQGAPRLSPEGEVLPAFGALES